MNRRQSGFSLIEVVLVIAVVVIVGLVGYNLYNMQQARQQDTTTTQQKAAAEAPATISTKADLDASAKALDATTLDNTTDTATLEKDIPSF